MGTYLDTTDGDIVGDAYIEELRPYETLLQGIHLGVADSFPRWVTVRSRDVRGCGRMALWNVTILDDDYQDRPFMEAWMRRYGVAWPASVGMYTLGCYAYTWLTIASARRCTSTAFSVIWPSTGIQRSCGELTSPPSRPEPP